MKVLKVNTGTDIVFATPSHPVSAVLQTERFMQKIVQSPDNDFEVNTNSMLVVEIIDALAKVNNIKIKYFINGKKATCSEVLSDLKRGVTIKNKILQLL